VEIEFEGDVISNSVMNLFRGEFSVPFWLDLEIQDVECI
jgi:hypothetical protein